MSATAAVRFPRTITALRVTRGGRGSGVGSGGWFTQAGSAGIAGVGRTDATAPSKGRRPAVSANWAVWEDRLRSSRKARCSGSCPRVARSSSSAGLPRSTFGSSPGIPRSSRKKSPCTARRPPQDQEKPQSPAPPRRSGLSQPEEQVLPAVSQGVQAPQGRSASRTRVPTVRFPRTRSAERASREKDSTRRARDPWRSAAKSFITP